MPGLGRGCRLGGQTCELSPECRQERPAPRGRAGPSRTGPHPGLCTAPGSGGSFRLHFADGQTEAQGGQAHCLRDPSQRVSRSRGLCMDRRAAASLTVPWGPGVRHRGSTRLLLDPHSPPGGASGEAVHACLHHTRTHTHTAHSHTHNARTRTHSACTHAHTHMAHAHGACTHNTHGTRTHKHACTNTRAHMHTHTYTHAHAHRQQPQSTSRAWLRPPPRGAGVEGDGEPGTGV